MRARLAAVLLGVLTAALAPARPALAVDQFSPPVRVTADGCGAGRITTDPAGLTRGFARCTVRGTPDVVTYLEGAGARWTRTLTVGRGVPVAVADDGVRTHLLYRTRGATPRLWLLTRTHGGSVAQRALSPTSGTGRLTGRDFYGGALLARDGRWLAVWSTGTQGPSPSYEMVQTGTLLGAQPVVDTGLGGIRPVLAFSRSSVQVVYVRTGVRLAAWQPAGWSSVAVAGAERGFLPGVEYSGRTTRVAYQTWDGYGPNLTTYVERSDGTSSFRSQGLGGLGEYPQAEGGYGEEDVTPAVVAAYGTTVWVVRPGISPTNATPGAWVSQRSGGVWTRAYYGDGSGRSATPQGLGASRDGAVLLMRHLLDPGYLSVRSS